MYQTKAYSAVTATSPLASTTISRRNPTARDVQIELRGIRHSDLHTARNEWSSVMQTVYPCVPGHEIIGRVTQVGSAVTKHKVRALSVSAWRFHEPAPLLQHNLENLCPNGVFTYNSPDKHGTAPATYGGDSDSIVVDEHCAAHPVDFLILPLLHRFCAPGSPPTRRSSVRMSARA